MSAPAAPYPVEILQLEEFLRSHPPVLVEYRHQDADNTPLSFTADSLGISDPNRKHAVFERLRAIGVKNGDHISVKRQEETVPIELVKAQLAEAGIDLNDPQAMAHFQLCSDLALRLLGQTVLEKVRWNANRSALIANYTHHAIFLDNGDVVHFSTDQGDWSATEEATICEHPFAKFLHNSDPESIEVVRYASGFMQTRSAVTARFMVILTAPEVNFPYRYSLQHNNCEHFATLMRSGESISQQVAQVQESVQQTREKILRAVLKMAETFHKDTIWAMAWLACHLMRMRQAR